MEVFKALSEITNIDERHLLLGRVTGGVLDFVNQLFPNGRQV